MKTLSRVADVLVVGAGPAGVSAAVMATSLGLHPLVVEAGTVAGKLRTIGSLENVPGSWSTGSQLAHALSADLDRLEAARRCTLIRGYAVKVDAHEDGVELTLADGHALAARNIVVATGVTATTAADAQWITAPDDLVAPPLWRTGPDSLLGRTYVLGADRPLGTWLRSHPDASRTLHVLHPPADDYKAAEVADDARVRLVPVRCVTVTRAIAGTGWTIEVQGRDGQTKAYAATTLLGNLRSQPAALDGLIVSSDGYCPPERQHPRIRIAGDLRSSRYQRITTAQGSGAEVVLGLYYERERVQ